MPLLLVRGPLEELSIPVEPVTTSSGRAAPRMTPDDLLLQPAIYVITYERDSIWNTDCAPFKPPSGITVVRVKDRTLLMDGVRYGYEAAPRADVIGLLRSPSGRIPLHRIFRATCGAEETIARLLSELETPGQSR